MRIHLSEILSQEERTWSQTIPLEMETFSFGGTVYPIAEKEPVKLTIFHKKKRELTLTIEVKVVLESVCDRCLTQVLVPLAFVSERDVDMSQTEEERIQNLEETAFIEGYTLDVDKLVEDELFVHMPMKVLCREDCIGLEGGRGFVPGKAEEETQGDPRMTVIRELFQKAKIEGNKEV